MKLWKMIAMEQGTENYSKGLKPLRKTDNMSQRLVEDLDGERVSSLHRL